jgi:hypothetical protein
MFDEAYPHIAAWVKEHGWIEIGRDEFSPSLIRALNEGGRIWESDNIYPTVEAALQECESALAAWMEENLSE